MKTSLSVFVVIALSLVSLACSQSAQPPLTGVTSTTPVDASLTPQAQILQAADVSNMTVLTSLLQKNPELATVADPVGDTPLHKIMQHHCWNEKAVEALLKSGADPGAKNKDKATPLSLADENQAPPEIMKLLQSPR